MKRTAGPLWAAALTSVALLASAGCGDTDADAGGPTNPTPTSQPRPEVTRDVSLKLGHQAGGSTLSATNESDAKLLVLLPVGEPERRQSDDGITLRYLRGESDLSGEEPELYEAAELESGSTRRIDDSSIGTWTSKIRICLETVPPDDVAADAGGGTFRVHGRESGATPVIACSRTTKTPATP